MQDIFKVAQFHLHSESEHTIDGQRYDLEMHSVHLPTVEGNFFGGVIGIIFDTEKYDKDITFAEQKIIDTFFESFRWEERFRGGLIDYTPDLIPYGDLMNIVNWNDRWVYKGSLTTPPCT